MATACPVQTVMIGRGKVSMRSARSKPPRSIDEAGGHRPAGWRGRILRRIRPPCPATRRRTYPPRPGPGRRELRLHRRGQDVGLAVVHGDDGQWPVRYIGDQISHGPILSGGRVRCGRIIRATGAVSSRHHAIFRQLRSPSHDHRGMASPPGRRRPTRGTRTSWSSSPRRNSRGARCAPVVVERCRRRPSPGRTLDPPAVHLLVRTVPAVHPHDGGLVPVGVGKGGRTTDASAQYAASRSVCSWWYPWLNAWLTTSSAITRRCQATPTGGGRHRHPPPRRPSPWPTIAQPARMGKGAPV